MVLLFPSHDPDLPGGVRATAEIKIAQNISSIPGKDGQVYQIELTDPGSGYTKAPSIQITGDGSGAEAVPRVQESTKAVEMGVATSEDATIPTTFKFNAPVYLLGNTQYAFVVKAPNSVEYRIYCMKLGENAIGTRNRVIQQNSYGSLFMSQDGSLWTEDQTQDVKFTLRRCKFKANQLSEIELKNSPLKTIRADNDPIETSVEQVQVVYLDLTHPLLS